MRHFLAFTILFLLAQAVYATSIVVLITPKYVLLGTDSRRTFLDTGSKVTGRETVCKIRRSGNYCFALAGFVASRTTGYSADSMVNKYLTAVTDYNSAVDSITTHIKKALQKELSFQKSHQPKAFKNTLASKNHILEIVILSVQHGAPFVQILGFELADAKQVNIKEYTASCPGDCPAEQAQFYLLGEYKGVEKYLDSNPNVHDPVKLVEQLITAQAKATPSSVGTPVNVVKFTANGMEWIK